MRRARLVGPLVLLALGGLLLVYMVLVESEPGAVPLALIATGGVWYAVARRRMA